MAKYPDKDWWLAVQLCIMHYPYRKISAKTGIPAELIRDSWRTEAARLGVWLFSRSEKPLPPEAYPFTPRSRRRRTGRKHSDEVWRKVITLRLEGMSYRDTSVETGITAGDLCNRWKQEARRLGIEIPAEAVNGYGYKKGRNK